MLKKEDVSDIIADMLSGSAGEGASGGSVPVRRVFLSDWELRRMRRPGERVIKVPAGAIISPLARDWIDYEGIEIVSA